VDQTDRVAFAEIVLEGGEAARLGVVGIDRFLVALQVQFGVLVGQLLRHRAHQHLHGLELRFELLGLGLLAVVFAQDRGRDGAAHPFSQFLGHREVGGLEDQVPGDAHHLLVLGGDLREGGELFLALGGEGGANVNLDIILADRWG
jgi:hypothetical protein